jgi:RimJ/RimL family protein N-acetyltransferase
VTERLAVRRFRPDDAETVAAYRSDSEVARLQGWATPFTLEQARCFIAERRQGLLDRFEDGATENALAEELLGRHGASQSFRRSSA